MSVLRRLPAFLSLLLLGALTLRLGLPFLLAVPLTLALLVALFISMPRVQTALAVVLWGGALAWLWMAWTRVNVRLEDGQPWVRLAVILCAVALFTAWAAWLIRWTKLTTTDKKHGQD